MSRPPMTIALVLSQVLRNILQRSGSTAGPELASGDLLVVEIAGRKPGGLLCFLHLDAGPSGEVLNGRGPVAGEVPPRQLRQGLPWNDNPRAFVWTKTAEEIFETIAAYLNRINDSEH
jgi:hypothetical protein